MDLDQGWPTGRLDLEPLLAGVAWVLAREAQGRGYAAEAAHSLVDRLRQDGWTVLAHVHPRPPGIPAGSRGLRARANQRGPGRRSLLDQQ